MDQRFLQLRNLGADHSSSNPSSSSIALPNVPAGPELTPQNSTIQLNKSVASELGDSSKPNLLVTTQIEEVVDRDLTRTPSPTASEFATLNSDNKLHIKKYLNKKFWFRRDRIIIVVILVIAIVLSIAFSVYDKQIVHWLEPAANKVHSLRAGFLIPISLIIILSFPPLFGHEFIELLCGFIYGTGYGFLIASCGTILGELSTFLIYKYFCTTRGRKLELKNIRYGCLAEVVRKGGLRIAVIVRYSVIPSHYATAVFATAGMNILIFTLAAFLSLPRQFISVYVGSVLAQNNEGKESKAQKTKNDIIENVVLAITIIITIIAMHYIKAMLHEARIDVIYRRRKHRQQKLQGNLGDDESLPKIR